MTTVKILLEQIKGTVLATALDELGPIATASGAVCETVIERVVRRVRARVSGEITWHLTDLAGNLYLPKCLDGENVIGRKAK